MPDSPTSQNTRRRFIRHAADVPIEVSAVDGGAQHTRTGVDVSVGGLSFLSDDVPPVGALVEIRIDSVQPPFTARARVVWARREAEGCRVGVQVCAIEQYRKQLAAAGRTITREAAAREWIERYGSSFPAI